MRRWLAFPPSHWGQLRPANSIVLLARGIMACCSKSSLRPIVGGLRGNNRALPPAPRGRARRRPPLAGARRKGQGNRCASSRRRPSNHRSRASCAPGVPAPHPILLITTEVGGGGWSSARGARVQQDVGCLASLTCDDCGAQVERSFLYGDRAGRTTFPAHLGASTMTALQDRHGGRRRGLAL